MNQKIPTEHIFLQSRGGQRPAKLDLSDPTVQPEPPLARLVTDGYRYYYYYYFFFKFRVVYGFYDFGRVSFFLGFRWFMDFMILVEWIPDLPDQININKKIPKTRPYSCFSPPSYLVFILFYFYLFIYFLNLTHNSIPLSFSFSPLPKPSLAAAATPDPTPIPVTTTTKAPSLLPPPLHEGSFTVVTPNPSTYSRHYLSRSEHLFLSPPSRRLLHCHHRHYPKAPSPPPTQIRPSQVTTSLY